jgi:multisubunit Na+/H+ antiporter MnhE subunit
MPARALYWVVECLVLFGMWLLFTASLRQTEVFAGLAAAAVAATAAEVVRGEEHPRFLPHFRWILEFWRVDIQILTDTFLLARKLLRMLLAGDRRTGRFISVPFHADGNNARAVAKRALAIVYSTMPPNTIVIGIDRKQSTMLVHVLENAGPPRVLAIMEGK